MHFFYWFPIQPLQLLLTALAAVLTAGASGLLWIIFLKFLCFDFNKSLPILAIFCTSSQNRFWYWGRLQVKSLLDNLLHWIKYIMTHWAAFATKVFSVLVERFPMLRFRMVKIHFSADFSLDGMGIYYGLFYHKTCLGISIWPPKPLKTAKNVNFLKMENCNFWPKLWQEGKIRRV